MPTAKEIIKLLNLKPLAAEGGLYAETYKSDEVIATDALPPRYASERGLGSAIYYLLTPETFSAMHRLKSDEIFHFYLGDPVTMLQLHSDGTSEVITLGHDIAKGERLQVVVPHGAWQGTFLNDGGEFALMGTTMSPGYEDDDFELGIREELVRLYPDRQEMIVRLTL
jgi:predicted cupin superfamily sugar epimerase